jgi:cytoskeleton protein RodZ
MSDDLKNKSVGSLLRQARLAQKGKLPEISENLRISHEHLKALEEDDVNGLPGLAYAVGFIRSYADHLGLDAEVLIAQYKSQTSGMSSGLDFPITEEDYELPSFILVSGLVVVSTIAYLFWAFLIDAEEIVMDKTNSISAYEETSDEDVASAISQESSEERSMDRPLMNDEALPEETASLISQKTEQKEAAIEEKTKPAGEEEIIAGAVVDMKPLPDIAAPPLYIRGLGQTWLRVTDEDGKVLYSSIILQGETFQLPPEGGIRLDTFDAGKLEYVYEDKTGPRLGKDGENLRGKAISVKSILYSIR